MSPTVRPRRSSTKKTPDDIIKALKLNNGELAKKLSDWKTAYQDLLKERNELQKENIGITRLNINLENRLKDVVGWSKGLLDMFVKGSELTTNIIYRAFLDPCQPLQDNIINTTAEEPIAGENPTINLSQVCCKEIVHDREAEDGHEVSVASIIQNDEDDNVNEEKKETRISRRLNSLTFLTEEDSMDSTHSATNVDNSNPLSPIFKTVIEPEHKNVVQQITRKSTEPEHTNVVQQITRKSTRSNKGPENSEKTNVSVTPETSAKSIIHNDSDLGDDLNTTQLSAPFIPLDADVGYELKRKSSIATINSTKVTKRLKRVLNSSIMNNSTNSNIDLSICNDTTNLSTDIDNLSTTNPAKQTSISKIKGEDDNGNEQENETSQNYPRIPRRSNRLSEKDISINSTHSATWNSEDSLPLSSVFKTVKVLLTPLDADLQYKLERKSSSGAIKLSPTMESVILPRRSKRLSNEKTCSPRLSERNENEITKSASFEGDRVTKRKPVTRVKKERSLTPMKAKRPPRKSKPTNLKERSVKTKLRRI